VRVSILGSGGGMPSGIRETACVLVRDEERALLLDCGTGARRLVTDRTCLDGVRHIDIVLTHFHLDHICGLPYLTQLEVSATVWAPGAWLYGTQSESILEPLRRPPIAPDDVTAAYAVNELREGDQQIGALAVRASAQLRHWTPSVGLRIGDDLALVTDTPYERSSGLLAEGVRHLLHEAWSSSRAPIYPERDATAADAAQVAREAGVEELTLIHLNPALPDLSVVLEDARSTFQAVALGEDEMVLA
jgi:ribonuclease BN (tRNA processing enzyme)